MLRLAEFRAEARQDGMLAKAACIISESTGTDIEPFLESLPYQCPTCGQPKNAREEGRKEGVATVEWFNDPDKSLPEHLRPENIEVSPEVARKSTQLRPFVLDFDAAAEALREEGRRNPTASCPTCAEAREEGRQAAAKMRASTLREEGRRLERDAVLAYIDTHRTFEAWELSDDFRRGDHLKGKSDG